MDIHHFKGDFKLKFDDVLIELINEENIGDSIIVNNIKITTGLDSYSINHIIYKNWYDGDFAKHSDNMVNIIAAIDHAQKMICSNFDNPIVVNCGYGYGRTAILILADQIKNMVRGFINENKYQATVNIDLELKPMIFSIQNEIANGALTGLRNINIDVFSMQIKEIVRSELSKSNIELGIINIS